MVIGRGIEAGVGGVVTGAKLVKDIFTGEVEMKGGPMPTMPVPAQI